MKVHWCAVVLLFCGLALAQDEDEEVTRPEYRELLRGPQLTQKQKDNIVDLYNIFRRQEGASNMKQVKYSESLEEFFYGYIYECKYDEGFQPNWKVDWMFANVNVFSTKRKSQYFNESLPIQSWFAEKENDIDGTACQEDTECRHYWKAAYAGNTDVGCAVTFCPTLEKDGEKLSNVWLFGCAFEKYRTDDFGQTLDDLYKVGEACSECDQDRHVCNEGLCAEKDQ